MNDRLHQALNFLDHNRGAIVALIVAIATSIVMLGCQVTASHPLQPDGPMITQPQLDQIVRNKVADFRKREAAIQQLVAEYQVDVDAANEAFNATVDEFERKIQQRQEIINVVSGLATSAAQGTFNPVQAVTSIIGLAGVLGAVGIGYDNLRKNRVIEDLKAIKPAA